MKSEGGGLIVRAINFQDFQAMWSQSTNFRDGQTDGQTTCDRNTALYTKAHRAVKTLLGHLEICFKSKMAAKNPI